MSIKQSVKERHEWFGGRISQLLHYFHLALVEALAPVLLNTLVNELVLFHRTSIPVVLVNGSIKVWALPHVAHMFITVLHLLCLFDAEYKHRFFVL